MHPGGQSLAPDTGEFRRAGHALVDRLADYLETVEDTPLFPEVDPSHLDALFDEALPQEPSSIERVIEELERKLLPYCTHVNHPGYFGLITATPAPAGILGDLVASALNQNLGAWTIGPSATALERRTVRWLADLAGLGPGAGGNHTSGGMTANFIGLKLARDWASGDRAQHEGVTGRRAAYVSQERHVSLDKAADAVGIGRDGLRVLPTDERFRIRLDALRSAIERDRREGITPICVIGIAGTTNTGAVDPLPELRRIADECGAWLHVDAAYGGGVLLSPAHRGLLRGVERADSVVIDPHKWLYAPVDAGAILVRDEARLTRSFGIRPAYLTDEMDPTAQRYQYYVHGFEQSRRFRALKVWMIFKRYGARQIGRWVEANIEQARHLYRLARRTRHFEAAMEPSMSAVCLRYAPPGATEEELGTIHRTVARRIEQGGRFWISTTVLKDRWYFRINPVNFRTRLEHMNALMEELAAQCDALRPTAAATEAVEPSARPRS
jgi:aromatic-L-amino-acid decarboxylase